MHENDSIRVTLIEPGVTDTDFFDNRPQNALADDDIARAVLYALEQPESVDENIGNPPEADAIGDQRPRRETSGAERFESGPQDPDLAG